MRPSRQQHSASPHPSPQKATASSAAFAAVSSPHAPAGRQPGVDDKENLDCSLLARLLPTPVTSDKHPAGHPAVASRAAKRSRVQGKLALPAAARSMLTFFRFLLFITICIEETLLPLWRGVGDGGLLAGKRRRPAAEDGVPPSLQITALTHILLARSPAPYSPFPPRRALSPTAFSGTMARPAGAPCSHAQTGPPDSATSPVIVLY